ncbi:MAG: thiamine phosphate synthase [Terriglobia bacterium]
MNDVRDRFLDLKVCIITTAGGHDARGHVEIARGAVDGGATVIQLREKLLGGDRLFEQAAEIRRLTWEAGVTFLVNDHVELAAAVGADGVHLGQDDMNVAAARRMLGAGALIGLSIDTLEEARAGLSGRPDYLSVGPVFPTGSKADAGPLVRPALFASIRSAVEIPVLAIGGVNPSNVGKTWAAGADGIAVISAVSEAPDIPSVVRALVAGAPKQGRRLIERHGVGEHKPFEGAGEI